ncbi:hypothetical protein RND81_11G037900 [Saponaria officinalis]|uniref:Uncharacterized protein n=1 Tax=Saponaria officinalis TaxID=3572 RepID=A0AAW1HHL5_SAPOF
MDIIYSIMDTISNFIPPILTFLFYNFQPPSYAPTTTTIRTALPRLCRRPPKHRRHLPRHPTTPFPHLSQPTTRPRHHPEPHAISLSAPLDSLETANIHSLTLYNRPPPPLSTSDVRP